VSDCPRCAKPLEPAQVDNYTVRHCSACSGVLAAHRDIAEILDGSWRCIPSAVAESTPFLKPERTAEATLRCPDCLQPMEKYGYMSLAAISIDRCDRCALLWLDASELQNMLLALAKSNYRTEKRLRDKRNEFSPLSAGLVGAIPGNMAPLTDVILRYHTQKMADDAKQVALAVLLRILLRL